MNSTNNSSIDLDINKFKKISKRLQSKIYDKTDYNIKLSIIQEALSESLGFRNFNDFKNQNNNTIEIKKEDISIDSAFSFFEGDIKDNKKIFRVLNEIIPHPSYNPSSTPLLFDAIIENYKFFDAYSPALEECSDISFLNGLAYSFKFLKFNCSENLELQNEQIIREYLESINYSPAELTMRINDGQNIEELRARTLRDHEKAYKRIIEILKINNMIKNNNITIYKRSWLAFNDLNSHYSGNVFYKSDIYQNPFYYKSWLHMESFFKLAANLDYLTSSSFKMSDLLLHTANIISPSLKENMHQLISILIDNYEKCIEISENFKDI